MGGAVFFWDQKSDRVYSYPTHGNSQVVYLNGKYIVASSSPHMAGISGYFSFDDPSILYELKEEKSRTDCNWDLSIDSLKKKWADGVYKSLPPRMSYLENEYSMLILNIFSYQDDLYSITFIDSVTVLNQIFKNKVVPIDTLSDKPLNARFIATNTTSSKVITTFGDFGMQTTKAGQTIKKESSGLVFIDGDKINFVEFEIPITYK